jgi:hypothetical protein
MIGVSYLFGRDNNGNDLDNGEGDRGISICGGGCGYFVRHDSGDGNCDKGNKRVSSGMECVFLDD